METLHITLFGHVHVVYANDAEPLKLARHAQALLVYLLLQEHLVSRDVLVDVLWMDAQPDRGRASLSTALWRLRQQLEPDRIRPGTYLITRNTGEIGFNWESSHWLDTKSFELPVCRILRKPMAEVNEEDATQLEGALTLYGGELVQGMYEDWAQRERERFRTLHLNCLVRLMEFYGGSGNFERSIPYGHEILRHDPLREEIHRALMHIYLESGQRSLAVRQYVQCCEIMEQELGLPPLHETQALYDRIVASPPREAAATGPQRPQGLTQLAADLQGVKQSLDEAARALARISQVVDRLADGREER